MGSGLFCDGFLPWAPGAERVHSQWAGRPHEQGLQSPPAQLLSQSIKIIWYAQIEIFKRILYLGGNYKIFWDFFYDVQRVTKNVCDIYGYTKMETSVSIRTLKLDTLGHG